MNILYSTFYSFSNNSIFSCVGSYICNEKIKLTFYLEKYNAALSCRVIGIYPCLTTYHLLVELHIPSLVVPELCELSTPPMGIPVVHLILKMLKMR